MKFVMCVSMSFQIYFTAIKFFFFFKIILLTRNCISCNEHLKSHKQIAKPYYIIARLYFLPTGNTNV